MSALCVDEGSITDKLPLIQTQSTSWIDDSVVSTSIRLSLAQSSRSRIRNLISIARWILDTSLFIGILVLALKNHVEPSRGIVLAKADVGGDITGFSPRIGQILVRFTRDEKFVPENLEDFFTKSVAQAWLSLVPRSLGFVKVKEEEKNVLQNLPHRLPEYNETVYTTSVTHQMHCLHSILNSYARAKTGRDDNNADWHIIHCFDYLRQSIMCAGDMALEGAQTSFPRGFQMGSDGFDSMHVCRDYNQVKSFLEERRADDQIWI